MTIMAYKKYSFLALALLLCGCGSTNAPLVGNKRLPDEMAVVAGPPLTLPPNFELRPPQQQKQSIAEALRAEDASNKARTILVGDVNTKAKGEVDPWLAEQAGTRKADPNIRQMLDAENAPPAPEKDKGFLGLFGGDSE